MRKVYLSTMSIMFASVLQAQVAINKTNTPVSDTAAMLEVKKAKLSKVRIVSQNFSDTAQLELSNRNASNQGTDFLMTARREAGLYFTTESDLSTQRNDSLLVLLRTGNIGVGQKVPAYKLDVAGDINMTGRLRVNGNAGTSGQILTSNGNADPSWRTASFSNATRFAARAVQGTSQLDDLTNYVTIYNTNTADVNVNATSGITINKTGLYHLDVSWTVSAVYNPTTPYTPVYYLKLTSTNISNQLVHAALFKNPFGSSPDTWDLRGSSGGDYYFTAGSNLSLEPIFYGSATNRVDLSYTAQIRGYLISE